MSLQLPFDYYFNQINEKIVREARVSIYKKIQNQVILKLQKNSAGVLPEGMLKNMWDEICVITQQENDEYYYECIDTIDGIVELVLEDFKLLPWQLCALWLDTEVGLAWSLDDKEKDPKKVKMLHDIKDIVKMIRTEYVLPAAMEWSNIRIRKFQQLSYEMDF